ncbi:NADAR family protein [Sessilibacter corallicola]|uniref:NADAR family protein n=1 Tax=Sessilibacter corallicola TaxID=2904075 RepID=UPI001E5195D0|nr:NADAR family protein [Sessilibacter corallicola]MCE2029567.1 NADAR family protein [Sessilibacter corallicola]
MNEIIKFYSVEDDYGVFSNFSRHPIKLKGKVWPTTEHYFQAMKFESLKDQKEIQNAKTPMEAARKGRDRKRQLRKNWESMKINVMRAAVYAKFTQNEDLKNILLSTGNSKLVEHTENDDYWGDGGDGRGKNMLGHILMEVRSKLQSI